MKVVEENKERGITVTNIKHYNKQWETSQGKTKRPVLWIAQEEEDPTDDEQQVQGWDYV